MTELLAVIVVGGLWYLAWAICATEMELQAKARRVARGFDRMAREIEGWRR